MNNDNPTTPAEAGPKRRFFSLRNLGRFLIGCAVLVTLIALFWAEENWRGKRAWENYRREAEARGVIMDWQKIIPPEVPEDQNFAMTPFLKPILEFNPEPLSPGQSRWRDTNAYNKIQDFGSNVLQGTDGKGVYVKDRPINFEAILAYQADPKLTKFDTNAPPRMTREAAARQYLDSMKPLEPVFEELQSASSSRPYARFNVDYNTPNPAGTLLPHLAVCKKLVRLYNYKSCAELAMGDSDKALADVRLAIRFQNSCLQAEPFLISSLVEIACSQIIIKGAVWEGMASHRWNEAQLKEIEGLLSKVSLIKDCRNSIDRGERVGFGVRYYDYVRANPAELQSASLSDQDAVTLDAYRRFPSGWLYMEQLNQHLFLDRYILPSYSADGETVNPLAFTPQMEIEMTNQSILYDAFLKHDIFAKLLVPALKKSAQKAAYAQEYCHLAIAACALERNRIAGNALPEKLNELVPRFLDKVPIDVIGGAPTKYKKVDDRHFLLYGIGWNGRDDGGVEVNDAKSGVQDRTQGDWVWPAYPEGDF